jgi:hypothetical protein
MLIFCRHNISSTLPRFYQNNTYDCRNNVQNDRHYFKDYINDNDDVYAYIYIPINKVKRCVCLEMLYRTNGFRVHSMKHHRTKHKRYLNADQKKTKQDELLGTKSGLIGSVLGHAVVRSSWGKSGCECKCHFQINGGLHHSSREAPLDTESLQIPIWCHVNKSKSPSSTRT